MTTTDPMLLTVISHRLQSIVREMENTLLRTGRSAVLSMARDFSCAVTHADGRLIAAGQGLPVHIMGIELMAKALLELRGTDIAPGDAFLHNDPYQGNTHAADHSILVPVFIEGRHVFTTVAKAHQADCGNSAPTTYMPFAEDVYEEGALIFSAARTQRDYRDVPDITEMCRARIRVPNQWYGDYLATVGAARIGERRLSELAGKYGLEQLLETIEDYFDYSERRMQAVVSALPAGAWRASGRHDPLPTLPEGISINVDLEIDPTEPRITIDLTDNPDCQPCGLNQTEASALSTVISGVFNGLQPDIDYNAGSLRPISVRLREGCVVGIPTFPYSCSVATTNLGGRLLSLTQRVLAQVDDTIGMSEAACGLGPSSGVISGNDTRRDSRPYVNQQMFSAQGGPATSDVDGWLTYGSAVANGLMSRDSVELDEQKYPIHVAEVSVRVDSGGAGRQRGGPGTTVIYGPTDDTMSVFFVTDGVIDPPKGVRGAGDGAPSVVAMVDEDGQERTIPSIGSIQLSPGEFVVHRPNGGGGYGNPLDRPPEAVRNDVLTGYVSRQAAADTYGVVFKPGTSGHELAVDDAETAALRRELRTAS